MKRLIAAFVASLAAAACNAPPETPSIDAFFEAFTAEWVRMSPNQAISARYFSGPEQDALETQITPMTREWRQLRVNMARRGLEQLATYDRARLIETQRVSADLHSGQNSTPKPFMTQCWGWERRR